jgi:hypothetical protein
LCWHDPYHIRGKFKTRSDAAGLHVTEYIKAAAQEHDAMAFRIAPVPFQLVVGNHDHGPNINMRTIAWLVCPVIATMRGTVSTTGSFRPRSLQCVLHHDKRLLPDANELMRLVMRHELIAVEASIPDLVAFRPSLMGTEMDYSAWWWCSNGTIGHNWSPVVEDGV